MVSAFLFLVVTAATPQVAVPNRTTGDCSPVVISARSVSVVGCGIGAVSAKRLQDSINKSIVQNNLTLAQVRVLSTILNGLLVQSTLNDQKLDRIISYIEGRGGMTSSLAGSGLVREVLDRTEQRVDKLKITLTRIEYATNRVSVDFDLVNEGMVEYRSLNFFGAGSLGNGASSLISGGNEVAATGVQFAGSYSGRFIKSAILPGVRYTGRVDFEGVSLGENSIDVLRFAFSNANLRPSMRANFFLSK